MTRPGRPDLQTFAALVLAMAVTVAAPTAVQAGLTDSDTIAGGTARLCEQVTFARGLRYGESEANVLDIATSKETREDTPRPVLLFVTGDTFTGDIAAPDLSREMQDQA